MTAVQFRAYVHRQLASLKRCIRKVCVWSSGGKVSTHADKDIQITPVHGLERLHGIQPMLSWRVDFAGRIQSCQPLFRGTVVDAACTIALNVAVTSDRARTGALPGDIAPQQEDVDDLSDTIYGELLLCHAQTPTDDTRAGLTIDLGSGADLVHG